MTLPVVFTANGPTGYNLTNSLRFRSSASAYLSRTITSNGSATTFTYSTWVKRGTLGAAQDFGIEARVDGSNNIEMRFDSNDTLAFLAFNGGSFVLNFATTQVFRDPSAWYHIIIAVDTTQATSTNRVKIYVNGSQITAFSTATYPSLNATTYMSQTSATHNIGRWPSPTQYFDGYLDEINFIDGQALTPTSFGSFNALTGVWQPARYTGTYGTNGFYLPFTNNSTTTTLGNDFSGNGNNWTTNNFSLTAGVTYDSMTDVPTLTNPTTANYCVMNPIQNDNGNITFSEGNLKLVHSNSTSQLARGTIGVSTGKWYFEFTVGTTGTSGFGVIDTSNSGSSITTGVWYYSSGTGFSYLSGTGFITYGATFTTGDVIGVALNCDTGTLEFYKNNVSQGVFTSSLGTRTLAPAFTRAGGTSPDAFANFGQRPFAYTPPTGFVALNTFNLPTSTIVKGNTVMDATLYAGTSVAQSITNAAGFKPDLVWGKNRTSINSHRLTDSVRGTGVVLFSDTTNGDTTGDGQLSSFNSNGFSLTGGAGAYEGLNESGKNYVAWQWKANGAAVTNTAGTISSQVSANTTSGFSVVTFTSDGTTAGGTVGHGLGVAPSMVIYKGRNTADNWFTYHVSVGGSNAVFLNLTNASTATVLFNSTTPTSSVIQFRQSNWGAGNVVAYCFAQIAGYSAFGSYTGNGSTDGPFVYLGFRPRFIMTKVTTVAGSEWEIYDTSRTTYNVASSTLEAQSSAAEVNFYSIDILSNGFKQRNAFNTSNQSGQTFIYMAFAENPTKFALAR